MENDPLFKFQALQNIFLPHPNACALRCFSSDLDMAYYGNSDVYLLVPVFLCDILTPLRDLNHEVCTNKFIISSITIMMNPSTKCILP